LYTAVDDGRAATRSPSYRVQGRAFLVCWAQNSIAFLLSLSD
jgi:hypothetical protein